MSRPTWQERGQHISPAQSQIRSLSPALGGCYWLISITEAWLFFLQCSVTFRIYYSMFVLRIPFLVTVCVYVHISHACVGAGDWHWRDLCSSLAYFLRQSPSEPEVHWLANSSPIGRSTHPQVCVHCHTQLYKKKKKVEGGGMVPWLSALGMRTFVWFPDHTIYSSSSRESSALFWTLQVLHTHGIHTYVQTNHILF